MATKSKRCLGVDIGSHSVKVAELSLGQSGLVVHQLASVELDLAPGVSEAERVTSIIKTLRKLLKDRKITTRQAVFCVPGQQTFLRRLPSLPRTTEDRLRRVLDYEADNLVPFPPDQSLRRFQIVPTADGEEFEVLLAAMKREQIDAYMRLINRTGLKPLQISVSPLALHNFYRFCERPYVSPDERRRREKAEARRLAQELKEAAQREQEKQGKKAKKGKKAKAAKAAAADQEAEKQGKKAGFSLSSLTSVFSKKKKAPEPVEPEEVEDLEEETLLDEGTEDDGGDDSEALDPELEALAREALAEDFQEVVAYVNIGARTLDLCIPKFDEGLKYGFTRSIPLAGDEMTLAIQRAKQFNSFSEAEGFKRSQVAVVDPDGGPEMALEGIDWEASEALTRVVDRMLIELRRSLDFFISQPDGVAVDAIAVSGGQSRLPGLRERMEERLGIETRLTEDSPNADVLRLAEEDGPPLTDFVIASGLAVEGLECGELNIDFLPDEYQVVRQLKKKSAPIGVMVAGLAIMLYLSTQIGDQGVARYQAARSEIESQISTYRLQGWQEKYQAAVAQREGLQRHYELLQQAYDEVESDFWFDTLTYLQRKLPSDIQLTDVTLGGVGEVIIRGVTRDEYSSITFATELGKDTDRVLDVKQERSQAISNHPALRGSGHEFEIRMVVDKSARLMTPPQKIQTPPGGVGAPGFGVPGGMGVPGMPMPMGGP